MNNTTDVSLLLKIARQYLDDIESDDIEDELHSARVGIALGIVISRYMIAKAKANKEQEERKLDGRMRTRN